MRPEASAARLACDLKKESHKSAAAKDERLPVSALAYGQANLLFSSVNCSDSREAWPHCL